MIYHYFAPTPPPYPKIAVVEKTELTSNAVFVDKRIIDLALFIMDWKPLGAGPWRLCSLGQWDRSNFGNTFQIVISINFLEFHCINILLYYTANKQLNLMKTSLMRKGTIVPTRTYVYFSLNHDYSFWVLIWKTSKAQNNIKFAELQRRSQLLIYA